MVGWMKLRSEELHSLYSSSDIVACRSVAKQPPVNSNRERMFSTRSLSKCYKQDKLGVSVKINAVVQLL
jgi:hypothetical protein